MAFLVGAGLQVLAALVYKTAMWYLYWGELRPKFCNTRRYRVACWLSESLALELAFDLGTIGLFGWSTLALLRLLTR